jgi:hypothetical protein
MYMYSCLHLTVHVPYLHAVVALADLLRNARPSREVGPVDT